MIINPLETVNAAISGFKLWYNILVPALLPFFIVSDLMVSSGVMTVLGLLLEPVMRPLFHLPGCASLVVVMGFTSGYPVGAILTRRLYDDKMLNLEEAEHLISFTNNSSPLFIIGAVGIGMLSAPAYGYLLLISLYAANLLVGVLTRRRAAGNFSAPPASSVSIHMLRQTWKRSRPLNIGLIMGAAVKNSIKNILTVAGFVIFFSVITDMFIRWGWVQHFAFVLHRFLSILKLSENMIQAWGSGLLEITLGTQIAAACNDHTILARLIIISLILAFGGFSVLAQIMSITANTPVRFRGYFKARLLQMILSGIFTYGGYKLFFAPSTSYTFVFPREKLLYSFDVWHIALSCLILSLSVLIGIIIIRVILSINNRYF
jgi:sporulation integral membrane protein YlbJ